MAAQVENRDNSHSPAMRRRVWGAAYISRIALIFRYRCSFCLQPWLKCWGPRGSSWGAGGGGARERAFFFPLFSGPFHPLPFESCQDTPCPERGWFLEKSRAAGWLVRGDWVWTLVWTTPGTFWPWERSQAELVFWLLRVSVYIPFSSPSWKFRCTEHVYVCEHACGTKSM